MPKPLQRESEQSIDSSPPSSGLDRSLSAKHRLIKKSDFNETFAQNRKWVGRYMVLWLRKGDDAALRLGVVASKKVHLRSNKRNRARRLLREAFRNLRPNFSGQTDVVLVARRAILNAEWKSILQELLKLAQRAELIDDEQAKHAKREFNLHDAD